MAHHLLSLTYHTTDLNTEWNLTLTSLRHKLVFALNISQVRPYFLLCFPLSSFEKFKVLENSFRYVVYFPRAIHAILAKIIRNMLAWIFGNFSNGTFNKEFGCFFAHGDIITSIVKKAQTVERSFDDRFIYMRLYALSINLMCDVYLLQIPFLTLWLRYYRPLTKCREGNIYTWAVKPYRTLAILSFCFT